MTIMPCLVFQFFSWRLQQALGKIADTKLSYFIEHVCTNRLWASRARRNCVHWQSVRWGCVCSQNAHSGTLCTLRRHAARIGTISCCILANPKSSFYNSLNGVYSTQCVQPVRLCAVSERAELCAYKHTLCHRGMSWTLLDYLRIIENISEMALVESWYI